MFSDVMSGEHKSMVCIGGDMRSMVSMTDTEDNTTGAGVLGIVAVDTIFIGVFGIVPVDTMVGRCECKSILICSCSAIVLIKP